jgi:hypothetical protein
MRQLTTKQKAQAFDSQQLVDKFNKLYSLGSTVMIRKIASKSYPYIPVTVSAPAFVTNSLDAAAFFNEISGYFSIEPDFVKYPEE